METKKQDEKKIEVALQPISVGDIIVKIKGTSDLIMDRFPDQAKRDILAKQAGISKSNKKKVRDVKAETRDAVHITSSGKIGFPSFAWKKGMMEATSFVGDKFFSKKLVSGAIKITNMEDGLIPIQFKKQYVLEHSIGANTKFSPAFKDWSCELHIRFDKNNITAQDITTLLNYAGFYSGIGSWRPKGSGGGSGEYGTYQVATSK